MKNNRRFFFVGVMFLVILGFAGCGFGKSKNHSFEAVFPKDAPMVMIADFSDGTQTKNFNKLIDQFPTTGFGKLVARVFDSSLGALEISWSKDLAPIFSGKWEAGFAVNADPSDFSKKPSYMYFAGKFSEIKSLRDLLNKLLDKKIGAWKDAEYKEVNGVEYWTNDSSKSYFAIDGDIFVLTDLPEQRDAAIERLENGKEGFDKNKMLGDGFVKYYIENNIADPSKTIVGQIFGPRYIKLIKAMGDSYGNISALEDGFRMTARANLDMEQYRALGANPDYKLSLVDKVNSKGLFYYNESSSLSITMLGYLLDRGEGDEEKAVGSPDISQDLSLKTYMKGLVVNAKLFLKKFDVLLKAPYAISISDKESFLPAVVFYFQMDQKNVEKAKELVVDFDGYINELIKVVMELLPAEDQKNFLKKDVVAVNGGALHRLFVDWSMVPKNVITAASEYFAIDMTTVKVDFYYGLMGDNVFVLAWSPDFPDSYGEDPLSADAEYKGAVERLGDYYGGAVMYFTTKPLLTYIDRFVPVVKAGMSEFEGNQLESMYKLFVRKYIGTINYMISSYIYKADSMEGDVFVKIGKIEG